MDDKNIEVYDNQADVLNRIQVLKDLGYAEQDMYIIANDEEDFSMLRGFTDVIIKEDDDSLWDKFKSFLKGEDSIIDAFHRMGLGEGDREFYHDQIKEGKIVLYVNKDYGSFYEVYEDGSYGPIITPDEPIEDMNLTEDTLESESNISVDEMSDEIKRDVGLQGEQPPLEDLRRDQNINILIEENKRPI